MKSPMTDPLRPARVNERPAQIGREPNAPSAPKSSGVRREQRSGTRRSGRALLWLVPIVVLSGLALPFYFLVPLVRDVWQKDHLRAEGVEASAEILTVEETNTTFNDQPVLQLRLRVHPSVAAPYEAETSQAFSLLQAADLRPGAHVLVKYDPKEMERVVVTETGLTVPRSPLHVLPPAGTAAPATSPSAEPTSQAADPLCMQAQVCCLTVTGPTGESSCSTFLNPQFPRVGCENALVALRQSAAALGKTCAP